MTSILDLPIEIVQYVCTKLEINDVMALTTSCNTLASRINSKSFWQRRLLHNVPAKYPCFPGKQIDWQKACFAREEIMNWFAKDSGDYRIYIQTSGHCVDAVHLFDSECNGLFACGDRGGQFSIFSLRDSINNEDPKPIFIDAHKHKGWIWTITSRGTIFATTCWDSKIRLWSLSPEQATSLLEFKMSAPVLCSAFVDENLIAAGTAKKHLAVYDVRAPPDQTALSSSFHQGAVLCLKSPFGLPERNKSTEIDDSLSSSYNSLLRFDDDYENTDESAETGREEVSCNGDSATRTTTTTTPNSVDGSSLLNSTLPLCTGDNVDTAGGDLVSPTVGFYTGSEDQFLAAWDLRNITQPIAKKHFSTYPRAISLLDRDEMWVAVPPRRVHVFRTCSLDSFIHTRSQSCNVAGDLLGFGTLLATPGAIFITGTPGSMHVLHPTMPCVSMATNPLLDSFNSPPVSLSYANETLLIGMGNGTLQLWMSNKQADVYRQTNWFV